MPSSYSDYIVYVDESGDHGLTNIDPGYPVFVLAFCIFRKQDYTDQVIPALQRFKFEHFGHDMIVLHEHEIRKDKGEFRILNTKAKKDAFMGGLTGIVKDAPFTLIATVIRKDALVARYKYPEHPYHMAMMFCLERLNKFLQGEGQGDKTTHIVFEKRGKREDDSLELEFRRVCDGANGSGKKFPFEAVFASKKINSGGLQFADLVARPVGLSVLRPGQPNRAFEVLEEKFYCDGSGRREGWGLKCFP